MNMRKRIITYGTFDVLHRGHINLLRRAKALGDYLIVGLSSDDFNVVKQKNAYYPFADRRMIMESIRYVDKVIIEDNWEQKAADVVSHRVDILVMGDDWAGKFDHLKNLCEVVYLPRTPSISSTQIKAEMF